MDTAIFRESCFVSIPSIFSVPKFGFRRSLLFSSVQLHNWRLPRYPPFRRAAIVSVTSSSQPSSEGFVDVISIGSRKDAVIDHCLQSPIASNRLRFWTIDSRNSQQVQLLQRTLGGDILQNVDFLLSLPPRPSAAILIVTAGYGLDDIRALELLNSVKSEGSLTVAVLLKPFCFEGQRRQKEVNHLVDKLRKCSHFYVVVETDALLKTEEETLEDAIRIVNNAILTSINMISTLSDDGYLKFLDTAQEEIKELNFSQIVKLLEKCGETKVGFGTGYDVRSSISQAVFNCPFLTSDMKIERDGSTLIAQISSFFLEEFISALRILRSADVILSEDTRHSRKLLQHYNIETPLLSYHKFNELQRETAILKRLHEGQIVAVISDAGTPGISDPGVQLAKRCADENIRVIPIPGPSALVAALSASGLSSEEFTFVGFLPKHGSSRKEKLTISASRTSTQIFYVPPHKLHQFLEEASSVFGYTRSCVIAREITKVHEEFWRGTLGEAKIVLLDKQPRGEITLLIEGNPNFAPEMPTEAELEIELEQFVSKGHSISTAVKLVSEGKSVKRKQVYTIALRKFGKKGESEDT